MNTGIGARALYRWSCLNDRRQARHRRGIRSISAWTYSIVAAAVGFAIVAAMLGAGVSQHRVSNLWLAVTLASHVTVLFGSSFRLYWRRDSNVVSRLAVSGDALFRLGLIRSLRATLLVAIPSGFAGFGFGLYGDWLVVLRHLVLVGIAGCGAGLLGPAVVLAAGAMVASDKVEKVLANMGGEFSAPKTSWLGVLPGLAAAGLAALIVGGSSWALGAETTAVGSPYVMVSVGIGLPIVAGLWALARAKHVMLPALLEVSALDRERLAHIDRTQLSRVEQWIANRFASLNVRAIFSKDIRLLSRRYPLSTFLGWIGLISLWGIGLWKPVTGIVWSFVMLGLLGVYATVVASRLTTVPIEQCRLLRALPLSEEQTTTAKRGVATLWIVRYMGLGCVPLLVRAANIIHSTLLIGTILITCVCVVLIVRRRDNR